MKVKSLSRVRLFETLWTAAYQAPLSTRFSRQEYWSGLPLPSPHKAEADVFLELSCLFDDPKDVGNLISDFSAFSKSHRYIFIQTQNLYSMVILQGIVLLKLFLRLTLLILHYSLKISKLES